MKRYSLWVKCLVFFLAVVTLLSVAVSGLGIFVAENMSMYTEDDYDDWIYNRYENVAREIAHQVMLDYGAELSDCPEWLLEQAGHMYAIENVRGWYNLAENDFYCIVKDAEDKVVYDTPNRNIDEPVEFVFDRMRVNYPMLFFRLERPLANEIESQETDPSAPTIEPTMDPSIEAAETLTPKEALDSYYQNDESYWDPYTGDEVFVSRIVKEGYQVTVGISQNYIGDYNHNGLSPNFLKWLFATKYFIVAIGTASLLLFTLAFILLVILAGKDPKTGEVNPRALNRLPLDLYLAIAAGVTVLGFWLAFEMLDMLFGKNGYNVLILVLLCGCGIITATVDVGFFMAVAAQFKVPGGFWWRHSICGRVLKLVWKIVKKAWGYIAKFFRRVGGYIRDAFSMLPVIWQWIAAGGALGFVLVIICATTTAHWYVVSPLVVWCLAFAALVIYCGYSYGVIQKGIRRMKDGDLYEKIDTQWLFGSFKTIAEDLNALADVVAIAAEKQLKSERMKTELITNVSHDIKTPLTSVINYVDLLQQPHTEEEGEQYLEVLSRQSARLKKLVEDLMDMSKASTGNMVVNITKMDAVETVNQALGEFADKLDAANLTPVFRTPEGQLQMQADGRLTWRVLSNILSNVVKYALPGTRVYVDLTSEGRWVVCSIKNISREELNISAEELTERFVRGDEARNTEGSGLGLNIAQSLMRLQHGTMELTVDGDMFKVTLAFPAE